MCSAPCAAAQGRGGAGTGLAFHAARLGAYAAGGAVVAGGMSLLAGWAEWSPALRPLWVMLHAAAMALGLWLLIKARQPEWMARLGRVPVVSSPWPTLSSAPGWQAVAAPHGAGWSAGGRPSMTAGRAPSSRAAVLRAGGLGLLWVAWPCGLLQSALLVSAMANHALSGAAAMAAFAAASAPGLWLGPWLGRRLLRGDGAAQREQWAVRAAGALLVGASAWALGHGIWPQVQAFCATL